MKNKLLILIFLLVPAMHSAAQGTFQKTFEFYGGGNGYNLLQTADGGYCAVGSTGALGNSDIFLIKTDTAGDTLWTRIYGGPNDDIGWMFQQTADNGFIITGFSTGIGAGTEDVILIRTDSNGDSLWTKTIGGVNRDRGNYVLQTSDGGFIITGYTTSFGAGGTDILIIKTDANGNATWIKTYGGLGGDIGTSIQQTMDGGYIITGVVSGFGPGNDDLLLMKTNSNGDTLWQEALGLADNEYGYSVRQTLDGGYIVAGYSNSFGAGSDDAYLVKTDFAGDILWSKTYGGTASDRGRSVQQTTDGGYILVGWTYSFGSGDPDMYCIKTDANGDTLWTRTFGGAALDQARSVMQTADGSYIISGGSSSFSTGTYDLYMIKSDSNGNIGCNQKSPPTVVTSPPILAMNFTININTVTPIVSATSSIIMDHGAAISVPCTTVGIYEMATAGSFSMFPNPSAGDFVISFSDNLNGTVEIVNAIGQKVFFETIFHSSEKKINLRGVSPGIYYVKIVNGINSFNGKIMIVN